MRAMVLQKNGLVEDSPLKLLSVPEPHPEPQEICLQVEACAVCHTDLHVVEGELPSHRLPLIPGHQVVGRVVEAGAECRRFRTGDRVGIAWLHHTCGGCLFCRRGKENLCDNALFTGYDVDGGYAEYCKVPESHAFSLGDRFTPVAAAPLLCAGIIGYRALTLSEIPPQGKLGLYGFGASAHITIQVAVYQGCKVYVFTRSRGHQKLALALGAAWAGEAGEDPGVKLDGAIIFAPVGSLVPAALSLLQKGGTLALAGIYMSPVPEMSYDAHLYHEKTLRSVTASTREDGENLLQVAAQIPVTTEVETFPLAQANQALTLLKQRKILGAGVLTL